MDWGDRDDGVTRDSEGGAKKGAKMNSLFPAPFTPLSYPGGLDQPLLVERRRVARRSNGQQEGALKEKKKKKRSFGAGRDKAFPATSKLRTLLCPAD